MIPVRYIDPDVELALRQLPTGITLQDLFAAFVLITLERHSGNKTRTSEELGIPVRTFRNKVHTIEALGYEVTPYKYTPY
jgi:DNA-binding NtrC family response regulator